MVLIRIADKNNIKISAIQEFLDPQNKTVKGSNLRNNRI